MAKDLVTPKKPQLPANLAQKMKELADAQNAMSGGAGGSTYNKLRITMAGFEHADGVFPSPMRCTIINVANRNVYYDKPWARDITHPPACVAQGTVPHDRLVPLGKTQLIAQQVNNDGDPCSTCWAFEWESAGNGSQAKACSQRKLMAIRGPDEPADSPLFILDAPPTALKSIEAFLNTVRTQYNVPSMAMLCDITIIPTKSGTQLTLRVDNPIPLSEQEVAENYHKLAEADQLLSMLPKLQYDDQEETSNKPAPRKKVAKKTAAKKAPVRKSPRR